jgi:hypothetical protein
MTYKPKTSPPKPIKSGPITAQNYTERAIAWIQQNGGEGFVIRSELGENGAKATKEPATPDEWNAWQLYYKIKNIPCAYRQKHGVDTTPTQWPDEFDPSYKSTAKPNSKPRAYADAL